MDDRRDAEHLDDMRAELDRLRQNIALLKIRLCAVRISESD